MKIALEIDRQILGKIAAESVAKIHPDGQNGRRWINAIAKATAEIEKNPEMTWQPDSHSLRLRSQSSGKTYTANGSCQCKAFEQGFPCYHRAAARLVALYIERRS